MWVTVRRRELEDCPAVALWAIDLDGVMWRGAQPVDGSAAALDEAIGKVRADASHRRLLEQGARAYYERWLLPEVLMSRLLEGWR